MKLHVKKGDTVMVIAGEDKGKTGNPRRYRLSRQKEVCTRLHEPFQRKAYSQHK